MKPHVPHCLVILTGAVAWAQLSQADEIPDASDSVRVHETITHGFRHPGIGFTKDILENARKQIIARREPWYSGFKALAAHPNSARNVRCRAEDRENPGRPEVDAYDNKGIEGRLKQDGAKARQQALMYIFTGDEAYRANAMNIVRVWSRMAPGKYKNYPEAHIHASYPVQDLIIAAELLRYSGTRDAKLAWKQADTRDFTTNFVIPSVNTFLNWNGWFMNQNGYPLAAAMSGDIFRSDRQSYAKRVEWFTVNRTSPNPGWSSSIMHLARRVDTNALTGERTAEPVVQLMEMGRDQAHAGGDIEIFMNTARQMNAQRTRVDPVTGTISSAENAVGPYEFLGDRILAAADHFCRFMLGYDTPWIPAPYDIGPTGEIRAIYSRIADNYRGRIRGLDFWDAHYYYSCHRGVKVSEKAPYYHEAFTKRIVSSVTDWIHIPATVTGEGARVPPGEQEPGVVEIEQRSTRFDHGSAVLEENGTGFIRINPSECSTRIAILSCSTDRKTIGMRIRTTGVAEIEMSGFATPWLLPDTRGEWRRVAYTMKNLERFGDIVYFQVKGPSGTQVDLDKLLRKTDPPPQDPGFSHGGGDLDVITYLGAPVRLDLSADTPSARISSLDKPAAAVLDAETGAFTWKPEQAGRYPFVIMASDGDAIAPKRVHITVTADRTSAIRKIAEAHQPEVAYAEAGLRHCKEIYDQTAASQERMNDVEFHAMLMELKKAFDKLEPLTPLLPDGGMDFTKVVVSSDIGEQIAFLADGNDDTFPVHSLARDMDYVFDFGEGFEFSATAFAMEGRLNFENRTLDTAFFGSDDGRKWTRLTPEIINLPTTMTRVDVYKELLGEKFRYLRIHKTSRKSAGLFEPSELRIYGQRHEAR